jgi:hypothetical protein
VRSSLVERSDVTHHFPAIAAEDSMNVLSGKFRVPRYYQGQDTILLDGTIKRVADPDPHVMELFLTLRTPGLKLREGQTVVAEYARQWRVQKGDLLARLGRLEAACERHAATKPDRVEFPAWEDYYEEFERWNRRRVQLARRRRPILRDLDYVEARLYIIKMLKELG